MLAQPSDAFDASAPWRINTQVSLRDEAFGAMAYHHGTRRLVFLKSPELVELVRSLERFESARHAMDAVVARDQHDRYAIALLSLASSEIICER
ncbi:MAG: mycofactocin biosynthesis chaperone MftB [Acidimicrobiales bacterium]